VIINMQYDGDVPL